MVLDFVVDHGILGALPKIPKIPTPEPYQTLSYSQNSRILQPLVRMGAAEQRDAQQIHRIPVCWDLWAQQIQKVQMSGGWFLIPSVDPRILELSITAVGEVAAHTSLSFHYVLHWSNSEIEFS